MLVPEIRGHARSVEGLPPDTLNGILQHFFAEIDRKDGKRYEPFFLAANLHWEVFT